MTTASTTDTTEFVPPGAMTDLSGVDPAVLAGLPGDVAGLSRVASGLFVHEFLAEVYGVTDAPARGDELEHRSVADLVGLVTGRDPRPLADPRPAQQRVIGNCRQFAVLTCALLRWAGVTARVRVGFAGYFDDDWSDHWIVQYRDRDAGRWVSVDPQLDETLLGLFRADLDPLDVPSDAFLTSDVAWRRCRDGLDDPERFGIQELRGWWFLASSLVRDLAALHHVETHVWDTWGIADEFVGADLEEDHVTRLDDLAVVIAADDPDQLAARYADERFTVPRVVHSHRIERDVDLLSSCPVERTSP